MPEVIPSNTERIQGRDALRSNIAAAKAIAHTVKSTLGPKGMDKMIVDQSGNITITNDGVTILKEMQIEHPAAKMLVEVAKTQENKVGDGTTTAVILAGELLSQAETLIEQGIHPSIIIRAYAQAEEFAQQKLITISQPIEDRTSLHQIATTAMTGKGIERYKEHLSILLINALNHVRTPTALNQENIKLEIEVGPTTQKSELIEGIILDKERVHPSMPTKIENANIILIDIPLEVRSTDIDAKIQLTDPKQLQSFLEHEEQHLKTITNNIIQTGATVVICQRGIDDLAQYYLAKAGILAIRRAKKSDMELLEKATNAKICSSLKELNQATLGTASIVQEQQIGENKMIIIRGCPNTKATTILLRAPTPQNAQECRRAATDALGDICTAINDKRMLYGAGATEIQLALSLEEFAKTQSGRDQLAIQAYAKALETIPHALAQNAGLDAMDSITALKAAHQNGHTMMGINTQPSNQTNQNITPQNTIQYNNLLLNTQTQGILEPLSIKTVALASATQVAEMILRIDDIILGKPKEMQNQNFHNNYRLD